MENPVLSVVIPIYKVEDYLERCVLSVINQDFKDLEVILVDDGSPDNCPQICEELAKSDVRIKVIHKKNGGSSSARNAGVSIARGKYIQFLDSDDQLENLLEKLIDIIEGKKIDILVFDTRSLYPDGSIMQRDGLDFYNGLYKEYGNIHYYLSAFKSGNLHESAYSKIINLDFFKSHDLYFKEGITGEDTEWMFRLLRDVSKIGVTNIPAYLYTENREGAITNSITYKKVLDAVSVIKASYDFNKSYNNILKDYELSYSSYLWFIALGMSASLRNPTERQSAIKQLSNISDVIDCRFKMPQVKKALIVYKLLGLRLTAYVMRLYLILLKSGKINNKKEVKA